MMSLAGGQGGLAHPELESSVPTRGADYAYHNTACPPGFENLTESLYSTRFNDSSKQLYSKYHILYPTMPSVFKDLIKQDTLPSKMFGMGYNSYTWYRNVCPGWPVYEVKCLCSRGWE